MTILFLFYSEQSLINLNKTPLLTYNCTTCHVDKSSAGAFGMDNWLVMRIFKSLTKMLSWMEDCKPRNLCVHEFPFSVIPDLSAVCQVLWERLPIPGSPRHRRVLYERGPRKETLYGGSQAPAPRISYLRGANKRWDLWGIQERSKGICWAVSCFHHK